jgi:hypothetical protein
MKWLPVRVMAKNVRNGYRNPISRRFPGNDLQNNTPRITVQLKCRLGIAAEML